MNPLSRQVNRQVTLTDEAGRLRTATGSSRNQAVATKLTRRLRVSMKQERQRRAEPATGERQTGECGRVLHAGDEQSV